MKIAFAGTPNFAATILRALIYSHHEVGLVISQPDSRRGRGRKRSRTPVAELAHTAGLPLLQPARISEAAAEISRFDALVVAAYGQILRPDTLYAPQTGAWNVHASLLPKYRGAAPVERAIMDGKHETGVTIMHMDEGLDTGPVALQRKLSISPEMTGGELAERLAELGSNVMVEALTSLEAGTLTLSAQNSLHATYATKITDEERVIRWEREAGEVHDRIRALAPHIGARAFHPEVKGPVKIWRSRVHDAFRLETGGICVEADRVFVGCGSGAIEVLELQVPGAKRLPARDFLLGNTLRGSFAV